MGYQICFKHSTCLAYSAIRNFCRRWTFRVVSSKKFS